jgi:CBS-domain-containing membrane protein
LNTTGHEEKSFNSFDFRNNSIKKQQKKTNSMVRVRERTISTERPPLVGEVVANFADKGCHVVSVTDPYGRILGFLERNRYFSIK